MTLPVFQQISLTIRQLTSSEEIPSGSGQASEHAPVDSLTEGFQQARELVEEKILSGLAKEPLQRYLIALLHDVGDLGRQLESQLFPVTSGNLAADICRTELLSLTEMILRQLPQTWLDFPAYPAYSRNMAARHAEEICLLSHRVRAVGSAYRPLPEFLAHMAAAGRSHQPTYANLAYCIWLLEALAPLCHDLNYMTGDFIEQTLIRCNFNHLGFLTALQQKIRQQMEDLPKSEQLAYLNSKLAETDLPTGQEARIYDPQWPSLGEMLTHWLREGIAQQQHQPASKKSDAEGKLLLNTSVAHLACYIHVFNDVNLPVDSLSTVFRIVAAHCRTKRQDHISPSSLAKEYYTTTQFTAARVREQLLKMAASLNARYFPAWIVIAAAVYFSPEITSILPAISN